MGEEGEVDSGQRASLPTDVAEKMEALGRENRSFVRPTRLCAMRVRISPLRSSTAHWSGDFLHDAHRLVLGVELILQTAADCPVRLIKRSSPSARTSIVCRPAP